MQWTSHNHFYRLYNFKCFQKLTRPLTAVSGEESVWQLSVSIWAAWRRLIPTSGTPHQISQPVFHWSRPSTELSVLGPKQDDASGRVGVETVWSARGTHTPQQAVFVLKTPNYSNPFQTTSWSFKNGLMLHFIYWGQRVSATAFEWRSENDF